MQLLLSSLSWEVPTLLYVLISAACLPATAPASQAVAMNGKKRGDALEAKQRGRQLISALQTLAAEDSQGLITKLLNREHHLDELCLEAVRSVRLHI